MKNYIRGIHEYMFYSRYSSQFINFDSKDVRIFMAYLSIFLIRLTEYLLLLHLIGIISKSFFRVALGGFISNLLWPIIILIIFNTYYTYTFKKKFIFIIKKFGNEIPRQKKNRSIEIFIYFIGLILFGMFLRAYQLSEILFVQKTLMRIPMANIDNNKIASRSIRKGYYSPLIWLNEDSS